MADTNTFTPNTLEDMIAMAGCDSVLEESSAADAFGDDFEPDIDAEDSEKGYRLEEP